MRAGPLDLAALDVPYTCVIQLRTQPPLVIHQITLRPDKVFEGRLIRLGETPGDEAVGWQFPENIEVVAVLGRAVKLTTPAGQPEKWECSPLPTSFRVDDSGIVLYPEEAACGA